jgi:dihydroxyacetone kinase-like protein
METIANAGNARVVRDVIQTIHENASYLSKVDGETGDGDHGVNMNKGFLLAGERITDDMTLSEALKTLGSTLFLDIGGSMGPIYGTFFDTIGDVLASEDQIDAATFGKALDEAAKSLMDLAGARIGDKTLVDTIMPAEKAFYDARDGGEDFKDCLVAMAAGAESGKEATKDMQAKVGRAARLGERSIGHYDAGAVSCCIILRSMATSICAEL